MLIPKLNLDQTEQSFENGDKLYSYNAGAALKSEIGNNDIAIESEFYVDLSERILGATYNEWMILSQYFRYIQD